VGNEAKDGSVKFSRGEAFKRMNRANADGRGKKQAWNSLKEEQHTGGNEAYPFKR